ncbi:hypothetical protein Sru01_28710 [Sphaerisporangium rufum]|uniref:Polyketide cyclase n=1 Tax=Sphaerisporangium rufum TaxID=1381558 RepID=A0A919R178_9ACTN|nr:SRPBCC family protein [Sphaerisporangium rufum]GII77889.1 hypothetical protein Sru01_28710 [Sphaerisporangium rufum]
MSYEASTVIEAGAERVWSVLSDIDRWPEWSESVTSARRLDGGPLTVGSRAAVTQPKLRPATWTVTELEPGIRFDWVSKNPGVVTVGGHRLTPQGDGRTAAVLTIEHRGPLAPLVRLFIGRLTRRYMEMEVAGLKRRSESG